jgi:hypothetical protein
MSSTLRGAGIAVVRTVPKRPRPSTPVKRLGLVVGYGVPPEPKIRPAFGVGRSFTSGRPNRASIQIDFL